MTRRNGVSGWMLFALLASACVKPSTKQCGDFTCSTNSVCSPDGTLCVQPSQIEACQTKTDGDGCTYPGTSLGVCASQVCIASACGNEIVEPEAGEICDDGNRKDGDGCSADCKSLETCGDGVTDFGRGEQCDCGTDAAHLPPACNGVNSMVADATCRVNCKPARCGDNVPDTGELCDDNNNVGGDGCNATCTGRWTRMVSGTLATITSVWASSKNDAWVTARQHVLHWNGTSWLDQSPTGTTAIFSRVWGIAANDVFVLSTAVPPQIWHYKNGTWADVTPAITGDEITAIGGSGTALWALGRLSSNGALIAVSWNGASFDPPESTFLTVNPVLDAWVAPNATLYFTAGADSNTGIFSRVMGNPSPTWGPAGPAGRYLSGVSATDITAFDENDTGGRHYNGTSWIPIPDSNYFTVRGIHSIAGATLVAGSRGNLMICTATTCTPSPTGEFNDLYDAFSVDPNHAFVVGDLGTILY